MKQGRCTNKGGCSKADRDEIIEVDEFDDFVCPECGHELDALLQAPKTVKKKSVSKGNNKMLFIIGGSVVALAIIAAIIFALIGSKEAEKIEPYGAEKVADNPIDEDEDNSTEDPFLAADEPEAEEVTAVEEIEEVAPPAEVVESPAVKPANPKPADPKAGTPQSSTHQLSYGTWTGGMKNGKPHGTGTLTYSTSRTIDDRDSKGRIAQPGEYVVGEWDNGHLVQGRWFKSDGSKEAIIIGKAG